MTDRPPEWFDPLPDIPGVRKRWRQWYSVEYEGMRLSIEEIHGEAYLVPGPPLVTVVYGE